MSDWTIPKLQRGDQVEYTTDPNRGWVFGFVTDAGERVINVFLPAMSTQRNDVRHMDDPFLKGRQHLVAEYGIFRLSGTTKALTALNEVTLDMQKRLTELEAYVATVSTVPKQQQTKRQA